MPDRQSDYFDYAAATPMDPSVLSAMQPYFGVQFYNPSASYAAARQVANDLRQARARVAHWLGARPAEIIFTAGGTEADNLAIHGVLRSAAVIRAAAAANSPANVIVSAIEHEAVLRPAAAYERRLAPVNAQGLVDVTSLRQLIDDQTALVSIMYANNEIGTVQPLGAVGVLAAAVREDRRRRGIAMPLYLHSDACQAAAYLDLHTARLGVDLLTINGGKIYGPKQSGALFVKAGVGLQPLLGGGGQEAGLRSGTENVAACIGLVAALDLVQGRHHEEVRRLQQLQRQFIDQLKDTMAQTGYAVQFNGSFKKRLPNNIHVTLSGVDNERLLLQLESRGILAAAGSACSAGSQEASHVLRALGLDEAAARGSLRFTMGRQTDAPAVSRVVAALADSLA